MYLRNKGIPPLNHVAFETADVEALMQVEGNMQDYKVVAADDWTWSAGRIDHLGILTRIASRYALRKSGSVATGLPPTKMTGVPH